MSPWWKYTFSALARWMFLGLESLDFISRMTLRNLLLCAWGFHPVSGTYPHPPLHPHLPSNPRLVKCLGSLEGLGILATMTMYPCLWRRHHRLYPKKHEHTDTPFFKKLGHASTRDTDWYFVNFFFMLLYIERYY